MVLLRHVYACTQYVVNLKIQYFNKCLQRLINTGTMSARMRLISNNNSVQNALHNIMHAIAVNSVSV